MTTTVPEALESASSSMGMLSWSQVKYWAGFARRVTSKEISRSRNQRSA
ncbi:MAG TPA: hypothetical protein VMT52_02610 [Planctomycetota bacterium]|nr:hypothetical protein [Planctomycetota bacterium]